MRIDERLAPTSSRRPPSRRPLDPQATSPPLLRRALQTLPTPRTGETRQPRQRPEPASTAARRGTRERDQSVPRSPPPNPPAERGGQPDHMPEPSNLAHRRAARSPPPSGRRKPPPTSARTGWPPRGPRPATELRESAQPRRSIRMARPADETADRPKSGHPKPPQTTSRPSQTTRPMRPDHHRTNRTPRTPPFELSTVTPRATTRSSSSPPFPAPDTPRPRSSHSHRRRRRRNRRRGRIARPI